MSGHQLNIIIVNWNGKRFLPDCLKSIADNPPEGRYEVVVVDNVSSDGSREWLESPEAAEIFPNENLKVILSEENLGFGRANNLAIEKTRGDLVFVLNPDTIIKGKAIQRLIDELSSDDTIGAVSPKLLNADGTLQASVAAFPPNPLTIALEGLRLTKILPRTIRQRYFYGEHWDHNEKRSVPVFWGTAILAKRKMIAEVGAFDEDFFMYGEDVEWCARMNRMGWKTVFVPEAEIVHLGGKSSEQAWQPSETTLRKDAADILVQKKSLPIWWAASNSLSRALMYSLAFFRRAVMGQNRDFLKRHITLHLNVVKDAFADRDKIPHNTKNGGTSR